MSDKLENYVKQNREDFDFIEPNAKLWNKIEARLNEKNKRSFSFLWKAAAIIIIFGFSFWAQMQMDQKPNIVNNETIQKNENVIASEPSVNEKPVQKNNLNPIIPEFAETEKYYNRKVNSTMKELKVILVKYPDVASDMKKDIAELDSVYKMLKRDLGDNVAHEEILSAMIQNYRMKLQILEDIRNELIQNSTIKPTIKTDSHEI